MTRLTRPGFNAGLHIRIKSILGQDEDFTVCSNCTGLITNINNATVSLLKYVWDMPPFNLKGYA